LTQPQANFCVRENEIFPLMGNKDFFFVKTAKKSFIEENVAKKEDKRKEVNKN